MKLTTCPHAANARGVRFGICRGTMLLAALGLLAGVSDAGATTYTWDGGQANNAAWGQAANWVGDPAPAFNHTADVVFCASGSAHLNSNVLGASRTIRSLTYTTNISGVVTNILSDNGWTANSVLTFTNAPFIAISNGVTYAISLGGDTNRGSITLSDHLLIAHHGSADLLIERPINGPTYSVTKTGRGTLRLQIANTFGGGLNVNGGWVRLGDPAAHGTGTVTLTLGTLSSDGTGARVFTNATSIGGNVQVGAPAGQRGAMTFLGPVTLTANSLVTNLSSATTFSGPIGDGGLGYGYAKRGISNLVFGATNTYTGATKIEVGRLTLLASGHGGGALAVSNNAVLGVTLLGADTLRCASLTLGAGATGRTTNEFALGNFAALTVPVVHATNLAVNGTNVLNLSGLGFGVGQFPLITYDTAAGLTDSSFALGTVPPGVSAALSNNTANESIDLVVTAPSLIWKAQTDTQWDTTAINWIDASASNDTAFSSGAFAFFDDGALDTSVSVTSAVLPYLTTFNNVLSDYTFAGAGGIGGSGALILNGAGAVTMGLTGNTYAAGTLINNGTLALAAAEVIPHGPGKGNVLVDGRLALDGYSETVNGLSGAGVVTNLYGTNTLTVGSNNAPGAFSGVIADDPLFASELALVKAGSGTLTLSGGNTYGGGTLVSGGRLELGHDSAVGYGPLTLNGGVTLAVEGGGRLLTNAVGYGSGGGNITIDTSNGALRVAGPVDLNANLELQKRGPNELRFASAAPSRIAGGMGLDILSGPVVLDGVDFTNENDGIRLQADGADVSELTLTNGAVWVIGSVGGNPNLILGSTANKTGSNIVRIASGAMRFGSSGRQVLVGNTASTTGEVIQTGGLVTWPEYTGGVWGVSLAAGTGARGEYRLAGGILETPRVYSGGGGPSYFRFDGGTLRALTNQYGAGFVSNLTEATVLDGGAIIDTAGWDITIAQPLLAGGTGGLTKNGLGALTLTGANTYSGATAVNQGALRLNTAHAGGGAITVADGGALGVTVASAGGSLSASSLTLGGGATALDLSSGAFGNPAAPVIAAPSLTVNGTVTVNVSGGGLGTGPFTLIDYVGSIGGGGFGAFALGSLPPGVQGVLVNNGGNSSVDFNITNIDAFVWAGYLNADWDLAGTINWNFQSTSYAYADGGQVRFDDTVSGGPVAVNVAAAVAPLRVTVASGSNYTFAGAGRITGFTGIEKSGAGTLAVNTTNDFAGPVIISGGTLAAGNGSALGTTAGGTWVTNAGTLDVNAQNLGLEPVVASGAGAGGAGAIVNNNAAQQQNALRNLTLAGDTTFGGVGRWDARWAAAGDPVLRANGHKITKVGTNEVAIVGGTTELTQTGMGDVDVQEGGFGLNLYADFGDPAKTLTLRTGTYFFMFNANTNILTKQVVMEDTARLETRVNARDSALDGTVTLNGINYVSLSAATTVTVLSAVGGGGALTLPATNAGYLVLAGSNTYAGPTTVRGGILAVSADANLGAPPGGPTPGNLALEGGTLRATAGFTLNASRGVAVGPTTGLGTGTLEVAAGTVAYGGIVADNPGGSGLLSKAGAGTLTLSGANTHSGGTRLSAGTLQIGNNDALGSGRLTLAGGALSSDSTAPRTLTNDVTMTATDTLGDTVNSGKLTLSGAVDFGGAQRSMTNNSDVLMTGITTNGRPQKRGPATLTLTGLGLWNGDSDVYDGTLVLDGAVVTNNGPCRPNAEVPGGWARVAITNGAALIVTNTGGNLRAGYQAGDGSQTNFMEVAGTVRFPGATAANGRAILGAGSARGILNLWPGGDLEISYAQSSDQTIKGESELNFRGGVLRPKGSETDFIRTLTNAFVRDGGAIFDTQGYDITVNQPLLNGGSGGLEKRGLGILTLTTNNPYVGRTTVAGGRLALGVNGSIASSAAIDVQATTILDVSAVAGGFTVAAGQTLMGYGTVLGNVTVAGALSPGGSIGTLLFANDLVLGASGVTTMEIAKAGVTLSSDRAVVSGALIYGGALVVTHSGNALTTNDAFTLFTNANPSNWFSSVSLPALAPGLGWDTNTLRTSGILAVVASGTPDGGGVRTFGLAGGLPTITFTGTVGATYILQSATNLVPSTSVVWIGLSTSVVPPGGIVATNDPTATNRVRYYRTVVP